MEYVCLLVHGFISSFRLAGGMDRRSIKERRSWAERRSEKDRRSGWNQVQDQRFQGVLRTAATVSHLFSQPLTVVMGHVDLLSSSTEEEHTKYRLEKVKAQLELMSKYIHRLRELDQYRTIDFHGLTMLDIGLPDMEE